jgi:hypothetical protein
MPSPPTCPGSAAGSRCSRSSSARTPSGCWPNDTEERWTRTRTELLAFLRIACAGIAAQTVGTLGMTDSLVSFMAMEEGLNERNVVAKVLSDPDGRARTDRLLEVRRQAEAGLAVPLPARGGPSLLASRPAPPVSGRSGPGRVGSPWR